MDQSPLSYKRPQDLSHLTGIRGHEKRASVDAAKRSEAVQSGTEQGAAPAKDLAHNDEGEPNRIRQRRDVVGVDPDTERLKPWGLALSGGGIRSATFSLGVTQALAQAPASSPQGYRALARFDYLSTVSGGGYIGAYLVSLFMKDRLVNHTDETQAAAHANRVLQTNPPLRLRPETGGPVPSTPSAERFSLSWLRENGRYLTPNGSGDLFFAAAVGVRNFFAVHYVIATVLFTAFLLSQTLQMSLVAEPVGSILKGSLGTYFFPPTATGVLCDGVVKLAVDATTHVRASVAVDPQCGAAIANFVWLSLWWIPALLLLGLVAIPAGMAYWIVHPALGGSTSDAPKIFTDGAWGYVFLVVLLCAIVQSYFPTVSSMQLSGAPALALGIVLPMVWCVIALVMHVITACIVRTARVEAATVTQQRRLLSLWLDRALFITLLVAAAAALETAAQTAYLYFAAMPGSAAAITTTTYAALAWLTHKLVVFFNEKTESSFLRKLPMATILNVLGIAAALALVCFWAYLAVAVRCPDAACATPSALSLMWWLAAFTVIAALLSGLFPGFVNLSSWHAFYSARLRRAYLGASNHERFIDPARSVVDTQKADEPKALDYRAASGAPIHLINVCVNQTIGAGGQLVQRDRKGKNLCVGPFGYTIDDAFYTFAPSGISADASTDLAISEWVGVSGAAFSTGLGRATSLGSSLLLGFANVRLGRWWPSYASPELRAHTSRGKLFWRGIMRSQKYLFRELTARFAGTDREWLYLSDGGHFENTGLYELLRPERGIRFVVVCDNGCDTAYEFDDLANAIRLARIDHGVEVVVDGNALADPILSPYLTTPAQMRAALVTEALPGQRSNRCAVLLRATHAQWPNHATHILLIKPRVIAVVPEDVLQYAQTNPTFPQQTTADQFFDEAQWESYRKLGLCIGNTLFGDDTQVSPFWARLQHYVSP